MILPFMRERRQSLTRLGEAKRNWRPDDRTLNDEDLTDDVDWWEDGVY